MWAMMARLRILSTACTVAGLLSGVTEMRRRPAALSRPGARLHCTRHPPPPRNDDRRHACQRSPRLYTSGPGDAPAGMIIHPLRLQYSRAVGTRRSVRRRVAITSQSRATQPGEVLTAAGIAAADAPRERSALRRPRGAAEQCFHLDEDAPHLRV